MRKRLSFILLLSCIYANAQIAPSDKNTTYPDTAWENIKDPSTVGWDNDKLGLLREFIIDSANTTGMMVVQHGKVIFTYGDIKEVSYIASCRKSILSMLYGPYVENGTIKLDKTLEQLKIDDVGGLLPIEKKATIRDLLTSRSGVYHVASYQGDEFPIAPNRGTVNPGSLFLYNNWDFNLAGYVFEKETGTDIYDAIDTMFAKPLKMEDWDRSIQHKEGNSSLSLYPAYPMWFSTRDMARIGLLMLRNGQWKNKQVLSKNWVKTITTPFSSFKELAEYRGREHTNFGYGYLWWVWDAPNNSEAYKDAYSAQGYFGQYITVLPALDLVIAHKTNDKYERATTNYFKIVDKLVAANNAYATNSTSVKKNIEKKHVPKSILERYAGDYLLPFGPDKVLKIFLENDNVMVKQKWSNREEQIFAVSDTEFVTDSGTTLEFSDLENDRAQNLTIKERGSVFDAYRVNPSEESALLQYEGTYYNEKLKLDYKITIKDHKLYCSNLNSKDEFILNEVDKDLFKAKKQKFRFSRQDNSKNITRLSIETKSLGDLKLIRKKNSK